MTETLYFTASNGTQGYELWRIDEAGVPILVKDIAAGSEDSAPSGFLAYNGSLYFNGLVSGSDRSLLRVGQTGEVLRAYGATGSPGLEFKYPAIANGQLYFTGSETHINELYTIGTDGVIRFVADLSPGTGSSPKGFTALGDNVYFTASTQANGTELYALSSGHVVMIDEISAGASSSGPSNLTVFGGTLYFTAYKASTGTELYRLRPDHTPALVRDINPHSYGSSPSGFTIFNGELYFQATTTPRGSELWKVKADGSAVPMAEINQGQGDSAPFGFTVFNDSMYFSASKGATREIWRVTAAGTLEQVSTINSSGWANAGGFTAFKGSLYFQANDGTHGMELWKITANGTVSMVMDIEPGAGGSSPTGFTQAGNSLYFSAITSALGNELWRIDANGAVTNVADINVGTGNGITFPFYRGVLVTEGPPGSPIITGGDSVTISLPENRLNATYINVVDNDTGETYALSGQDAKNFAISSSGALNFLTPPDFEKPKDHDKNNVYKVTVTVTDVDGYTDSQALTIKVTNVNGVVYVGSNAPNKKTGTLEADVISGKDGNDTLRGSGSNDTINGGKGNDRLFGGDGNDKLTGGDGKDWFTFNTPLATAGVDKITDFSHVDDTIRLDDSVFKALGKSVASNEFVANWNGHAATTTSQHLIYDKSTGTLWYDSNGKAAGGDVKIAQLGTTAPHPWNLAYDDFVIV